MNPDKSEKTVNDYANDDETTATHAAAGDLNSEFEKADLEGKITLQKTKILEAVTACSKGVAAGVIASIKVHLTGAGAAGCSITNLPKKK